jgi:hypothetical protein
MSDASFHHVISEHLALSERNKRLERRMPLDRYREHPDGGASAATPPEHEPETEATTREQEHWLDPDSFWETTPEGPAPEFDDPAPRPGSPTSDAGT